MRILITTGIYPPQIGGPAEYAKNLAETLKTQGHQVFVSTYGLERNLPTGFRHLFFFFKILPKLIAVDFCISLDTISVGLPAVAACRVFNKKIIIRTGGDFLWEQYLERTKKKILLREFYMSPAFSTLSFRERKIFNLTKWVLKNVSAIVFSTDWQKNIWAGSYKIDPRKVFIIENFYGPKLVSNLVSSVSKVFIGASRQIQFKNLDTLDAAFLEAKKSDSNLSLDLKPSNREIFLKRLKNSYAAILISLGDISPNFILDAISLNKPFILTRENGINDRVKDIAILVDPLNKQEITEKILFLANPENYQDQIEKIQKFSFTHSWQEIADEFISIFEKL